MQFGYNGKSSTSEGSSRKVKAQALWHEDPNQVTFVEGLTHPLEYGKELEWVSKFHMNK